MGELNGCSVGAKNISDILWLGWFPVDLWTSSELTSSRSTLRKGQETKFLIENTSRRKWHKSVMCTCWLRSSCCHHHSSSPYHFYIVVHIDFTLFYFYFARQAEVATRLAEQSKVTNVRQKLFHKYRFHSVLGALECICHKRGDKTGEMTCDATQNTLTQKQHNQTQTAEKSTRK